MKLYSIFSKVVHSNIEGPAGHINNRNAIGNAFRVKDEIDTTKDNDQTDVLIFGALYSLIALDPLVLKLLENEKTIPFPDDPDILHDVSIDDLQQTYEFLKRFIEKYKE
jgi:hypothetical protein